jgi:hypothetical protein
VLWDDANDGIRSAAVLSSGNGDVLCLAPVLRAPALMLQTMLWTAVVDCLRTAVSERTVGAHPVTREVLRAALQREGPQVTRLKAKAREVGRSTRMAFTTSYMLASPSASHKAPGLEHAPPRTQRLKETAPN